MANFEYVALDAKGQETTGSIKANDEGDAIAQLRKSGLYPTQVVPAGKGGVSSKTKSRVKKSQKGKGKGSSLGGKVKGKVLMIFTRQLATLVDAGLPLLRGLSVLGKQEKNKVMAGTINHLADSVAGGAIAVLIKATPTSYAGAIGVGVIAITNSDAINLKIAS